MGKIEDTTNDNTDVAYRLKAGAFLTISAGFGLLFGFGSAIAAAKKSGNETLYLQAFRWFMMMFLT